jgi:pimeloyl-ACP methyl ester carboxylesterase
MTDPSRSERVVGGVHILKAGPDGSRPTVILLHYFGGSLREWRPVMERLATARGCIAVDLPGFGQSPPLRTYTLDGMADVVETVVRSLKLREYVLAGHSMSGKISVVIAARRPPGLRGLVLVAPSPPTPEPMEEDKRSTALKSNGLRRAALSTLKTITAHPLAPDVLAEQVSDNVGTAPAAWTWWLADGSRVDVSDRIGRVEVPILVVGGSADPVITPEVLDHDVITPLKGRIEKVVMADSGHLIPLEAPDVLAQAIESFVVRLGHHADQDSAG